MQSYLLVGGDKETRAQYLSNLTSPQVELLHILTEKSSISIKQIQDLQSPLSISPRLPRIVWIEEAGTMTIPAQNSLLKMLEEPPLLTSFYLTTGSTGNVLPTIKSRTQIVKLDATSLVIDPQVLADLKHIMGLSPGDRINAIVKRDRQESIAWITQIEVALKDKLHDLSLESKQYQFLGDIAHCTQLAHLELSANCSVGLVTQNFLLSLPKTK